MTVINLRRKAVAESLLLLLLLLLLLPLLWFVVAVQPSCCCCCCCCCCCYINCLPPPARPERHRRVHSFQKRKHGQYLAFSPRDEEGRKGFLCVSDLHPRESKHRFHSSHLARPIISFDGDSHDGGPPANTTTSCSDLSIAADAPPVLSDHEDIDIDPIVARSNNGGKLPQPQKQRKRSRTKTTTVEAPPTPASKESKSGRDRDASASFWRVEDDGDVDEDLFITHDKVVFRIRGNPRPLRRHRTSRGFMYNPSSAYQREFRELVEDMIWPSTPDGENYSDGDGDGDETITSTAHAKNCPPFFAEDDQLSISMVFRLKRPLKHFVASKRGIGRLKQNRPNRLSPSLSDVDNLCKFVLDSLNKLLYDDDRQVASLQATKFLDDEGLCEGSILVSIERLKDQDLDERIRRNF